VLDQLARSRLDLPNTDFDTGKPSRHGEYALADETYAELIDRLSKEGFTAAPVALRRNIAAYYSSAPARTLTRKEEKRLDKIRKKLTALLASAE
jgi:hypothetical protein